jgi:hypothetical protein
MVSGCIGRPSFLFVLFDGFLLGQPVRQPRQREAEQGRELDGLVNRVVPGGVNLPPERARQAPNRVDQDRLVGLSLLA